MQPFPESVALFGSFVSATLHPDSDIDILLIGDSIPRKPFEKAVWLMPLVEKWREVQSKEFLSFPRVLSPLTLSRQGLLDSVGLRLSLATQCWILTDSGFLSSALNEATRWLSEGKWKRQPLEHGGWVWMPFKESA